MAEQFYFNLFVLGIFVSATFAQGPADIAAAISDAVATVSARRPDRAGAATLAATGIGFAGPATLGSTATGALTGVAAPGTGSVADNPVSIHALFSESREAPGAVAAAGAAGEIASTATANFAARTGGATPDDIEFMRQIAPFCPVIAVTCNPNDRYRTVDGSCNNLNNPRWGASFIPQRRFIPPEYGDTFNTGITPRIMSVTGSLLPSPRVISNAVHNAGVSAPRSVIYNVGLTHFGQFIDHDVISTPLMKDGNLDIFCCNGNIPVNRPECFSFETPPGDFLSTCMPFVRSDLAVETGCPPGPRNQMNQRTSYLDLSVTYGNTMGGASILLEPGTGRLQENPMGRILPDAAPGEKGCIGGERCFKSGDHRVSEIPMLTVIHIIFLREHNNIVEGLRSLGWTGERLFQEARKILTGIYQHIIYSEFLPAVLGEEGMVIFGLRSRPVGYNTRYDPTVDASTRNAFGAAAYRFGHSLIGNFVGSFNLDFFPLTEDPLERHFFSTRSIRNMFGPDRISRWMTTQFQSNADRFLTSSVRNHLFETMPGNGLDLSALNIQRGRDHGLPSYNKYRRFCGLIPASHFGTGPLGLSDHDSSSAAALASVYSHPEDIDLFPGALSERPLPGALVGPTFRCLIGLQFSFYKTGDRFFYENNFIRTGFTPAQLREIKSQSMSALYCRTMNVNRMPVNAFVSSLSGAPRIPCQFFNGLDLRPWSRFNSPFFSEPYNGELGMKNKKY